MENFETIISVIESLVALVMLCGLIWVCTKAFKLKGFIISVAAIILIFLGTTGFEKFLDYSYNNAPILIIIFFGAKKRKVKVSLNAGSILAIVFTTLYFVLQFFMIK